jgi:hypothetical protein
MCCIISWELRKWIILIRRCVRREKEKEFLASYVSEKPSNPDFVDEWLTRVDSSEALPESMRSFAVACDADCVTYINVAMWRTAAAFRAHFNPKTMHDPKFECSDRHRAVLEIQEIASTS